MKCFRNNKPMSPKKGSEMHFNQDSVQIITDHIKASQHRNTESKQAVTLTTTTGRSRLEMTMEKIKRADYNLSFQSCSKSKKSCSVK